MQINWFIAIPSIYVLGVVVTENGRIAAGLSRWDNPNGESLLWPLDVVIFAFASIYWLLIAPGRFIHWLFEKQDQPEKSDKLDAINKDERRELNEPVHAPDRNWACVPEAANLLGYSETTLRRRIKSGLIQSTVWGGRRFVLVS